MDLSNPDIYVFYPQYNMATLTVPLTDVPSSPYRTGDRLNVTITFPDDQRLLLTANPTGQSAPIGLEGIGIFVEDSAQPPEFFGSLSSSLTLIAPSGAYLIDSASLSLSFGSSRGAITRVLEDWTDSSFSVAGFEFQINIGTLDRFVGPDEVLPNQVVLELREFQLQAVPEPAMGYFLVAALGVFWIARRFFRGARA